MNGGREKFVFSGNLPSGVGWKSDDIFSAGFDEAFGRAAYVVLLDPAPFPFELYKDRLKRPIIYFVLPSELSDGDIINIYQSILAELTFFDRVVSFERNRDVIMKNCSLMPTQWIVVPENSDVLEAVEKDFARRNARFGNDIICRSEEDPSDYWRKRGAAMAQSAPEISVCSARHELITNKRMHILQVAMVNRVLDWIQPNRGGWSVVEFGCGVGRILCEFEKRGAEITGLDVSEQMLDIARKNLPKACFVKTDFSKEKYHPPSQADIAVFVTVFHHIADGNKEFVLENAWQAVRRGGYVVLLEDFVSGSAENNPTTMTVSIRDFFSMAARISRGYALLDFFRTIRYPHLADVRTAIVVLRKL